MTCSGCAATVEERLSKVQGITGVKVDLAKQEATVVMSGHVATDLIQQALRGTKYSITNDGGNEAAIISSADEPAALSAYLPVFLIFGYITTVTVVIQLTRAQFNFSEWMSHFMAGFFLTFSFFKLLDIPAFAASYSSYDIIARRWFGYGYIYPFLELALGFGFLLPQLQGVCSGAAFILMSVSIAGVITGMLRKQAFQCACLGGIFKLPLSRITLFEDALMIFMSAWMILMSY